MNGASNMFDSRIAHARRLLIKLVESPGLRFDNRLRSSLPEQQGIYRIYDDNNADVTLRAGRTKSAASGLRQRVYQNHFMGDQKGNLRQQLVDGGLCSDLEAAKIFLKDNCRVQVLVVNDDEERKWIEYFMLSILRPIYSD